MDVAPCAGAGIETKHCEKVHGMAAVAPCAGAGIETRPTSALPAKRLGRPLRGGGD